MTVAKRVVIRQQPTYSIYEKVKKLKLFYSLEPESIWNFYAKWEKLRNEIVNASKIFLLSSEKKIEKKHEQEDLV